MSERLSRAGNSCIVPRAGRRSCGTIVLSRDLAEGPRSRTERNDFKKVGTCPELLYCCLSDMYIGQRC